MSWPHFAKVTKQKGHKPPKLNTERWEHKFTHAHILVSLTRTVSSHIVVQSVKLLINLLLYGCKKKKILYLGISVSSSG